MSPSQFNRDITLSGTTGDSFVAPFTGEFWIVNVPGNQAVNLSKIGKTVQVISPGSVDVVHLVKGEELGISGTAGNIVSVYDKFDVKLIPTSKDVLGAVQIADSTGSPVARVKTTAGLASDAALIVRYGGQLGVTTVSGSVTSATLSAGSIVRIQNNNGPVSYGQVAFTPGPTLIATVTPCAIGHFKNIDAANDCYLGSDNSVSTSAGYLLKANSVGEQSEMILWNTTNASITVYAVAAVSSTVSYFIH